MRDRQRDGGVVIVEVPTRAPAERDVPRPDVGWAHVAVLALVLLLVLVLYAVGVLLPWYVNDLHHLPLDEAAHGGHDPEGLWPRDVWARPVAAAGLAGVVFGPALTLVAGMVGGAWLASVWRRAAAGRTALAAALLVVVAGSVAELLFLLSDTGVALKDWRLD